jgi:hypothetical protein
MAILIAIALPCAFSARLASTDQARFFSSLPHRLSLPEVAGGQVAAFQPEL